jgi:hypothetical protein
MFLVKKSKYSSLKKLAVRLFIIIIINSIKSLTDKSNHGFIANFKKNKKLYELSSYKPKIKIKFS